MGVRCLSVFVSVLLFLFVCLLIWLVLGLLRVVVVVVVVFFWGGCMLESAGFIRGRWRW